MAVTPTEPPPEVPVIKHLDFSQYHPLGHTLWACQGWPGGRRRHLEYRWDFQWRDWLRGKTLCLLGKHAWVQWFRGRERNVYAGTTCKACGKKGARG